MKHCSKIIVLATLAPLLVIQATTQQTEAHLDAGAVPGSSLKATAVTSSSGARPAPAPAVPASEFIIGADDVLSINVWKEPELSHAQVPVRSDGKISLPLIGDVQASGRTPQEVQAELTARLRDYVVSPVVTVMVREMKSRSFNVLGEVMRPGAFPLEKPTSVLDAIAVAGGFREWARVKSIYVLRRETGATRRMSFDYKKAIRGGGGDFELLPRDTVVVP